MLFESRETIVNEVEHTCRLDRTVAGSQQLVNATISVAPSSELESQHRIIVRPVKGSALHMYPPRRQRLAAINNGLKAGLSRG